MQRFLELLDSLPAFSAKPREKTPSFTEADFLPVAAHIDPYTLLTKNGEQLQIIRIAADAQGRAYETESASLRSAIREAVQALHLTESYALWFHTIRRRQPLPEPPVFKENAAMQMHASWQAAHAWRYSFRNEVYITLLHRGQTAPLLNMKELKRGARRKAHRRFRENYLEETRAALERSAAQLAQSLSSHFQAERLHIEERAGVHYSQPLEFMHLLLNLTPAEVPVTDMDASRQLATHDITFGFDALEARAPGSRHFGTVLSLKGCPELPLHALDSCLQLPEECIITQTISFLPQSKAAKKQGEIRDVLETSPDDTILHLSGLAEMLEDTEEEEELANVHFAEQHISIMVIREHYAALDSAVGRIQQAFGQLGLITVREDIMLEEAFWAQIPGNFAFIRRTSTLPSARMAGLARLNHFPCGDEQGKWGGPVALFPTTLQTPYAFHFHVGENGHTAVLDFNSFTDARGAILVNFLISQVRQYDGRLLVLDRHFSARPLIQELGGSYFQPMDAVRGMPKNLQLNPLQLPDSARNRAFLAAWLGHFLPAEAVEEARGALEEAVSAQFALAPQERSVHTALAHLAKTHPQWSGAITAPDRAIFGAGEDTLCFATAVSGIELGAVADAPAMALPVFSYLLHRLISELDGKPTVIVLHEAWEFLDNPFFTARIGSLLAMLSKHNALLIMTTRRFGEHAESYFTAELMPLLANTLFLPDDVQTDALPAAAGLTAAQESALAQLDRQKGEFLIRHGGETAACVFSLSGMEAHFATLTGDTTGLRLAQLRQKEG